MERLRNPFQGVWNIVRFNWHFYALSAGFLGGLFSLHRFVPAVYGPYFTVLTVGAAATVLLSLLVSFYVYDLSNLYTLSWLDEILNGKPQTMVTINAGFDETSALLQRRFPDANLHVFDFYDPQRHTEVSIRRARQAYPAYPGTIAIETSALPLPGEVADMILLLLAAHEIRQAAERIHFFEEVHRILKPAGTVIVVEHLRDGANFLAYTIGFFHFLSETTWLATFGAAAFRVSRRLKLTPFVTVFVLRKDDSSA